MVRLIYIYKDGTRLETDFFEPWKVPGYMAVLGAQKTGQNEWITKDGARVSEVFA